MATASSTATMRFSWSAVVTALLVAAFLAGVAFWLLQGARHPQRTGASNGQTFFEWWYALHIVGGTLVMLVAPFQFIAPIRNRFRRYHRWAGYAFVTGSLMTFAGYWLIQPTERDTLAQLLNRADGPAFLLAWLVSAFDPKQTLANQSSASG